MGGVQSLEPHALMPVNNRPEIDSHLVSFVIDVEWEHLSVGWVRASVRASAAPSEPTSPAMVAWPTIVPPQAPDRREARLREASTDGAPHEGPGRIAQPGPLYHPTNNQPRNPDRQASSPRLRRPSTVALEGPPFCKELPNLLK